MPENDKTDTDNQPKSGEDQEGSQRGLWLIIAAGFVAVVAVIFVGSFWISPVDRTRFITEFILTVALADLVAVQAYIYKKQWTVMDQQFTEFENQTRQSQQNAAFTKARMQEQSDAMKGQLDAMKEQLTLTRDALSQNERAVVAAETTAKVTKAGEAPYFGIIGISLTNFVVGRYPGVDINFFNGGRTPAWHFYALPVLVMGDDLDSSTYWRLTPTSTDMATSFIPSGKSQGFTYEQKEFIYTQEMRRAIESEETNLFVVTTIEYRDHRNVKHPNHTFKCIWNHRTGTFNDFEAA